jgi:nitrogen fixation/metabolism regulation signal transduction histidine kinase
VRCVVPAISPKPKSPRRYKRNSSVSANRYATSEQSALQQSERTLARLSEAQQRTLVSAVAESLRTVQNNLQENLTRQLTQAFEETSRSLAASADELRFSIDARLRDAFIVAMLCVLAFLLFGAVFLHRTLVRPLRALVKVTHEIAAGDLSKRVVLPRRGCPDLDDLADSFNHMVDAVQAEPRGTQTSRGATDPVQQARLAGHARIRRGARAEPAAGNHPRNRPTEP